MPHKIIKYASLSSTQDEAKRLCKTLDAGTVILAETQDEGRGKPGSRWFSPAGGLYFSLILKPKKDVSDLLFITKMTAEVVVSVLASYGLYAAIKLPNDVLVDGRKICGILTERSKEALIIGIGVNLNIAEFPNDLLATSTQLLTGKQVDAEAFLKKFLAAFDNKYFQFIGNEV